MYVELVGDVTARAVNDLIRRTHHADTIVIRLDSLGGDAAAGLRLHQHLLAVRRRGVHVTTVAERAGSIAAVIAPAASARARLILSDGLIGVHAPHGPIGYVVLHVEAQIVAALCARSSWTPVASMRSIRVPCGGVDSRSGVL